MPDGWEVEDVLLERIKTELFRLGYFPGLEFPPGAGTVLELGSGYSTQWLVDRKCKVFSIEHDKQWIGKVKGAKYIHAPIALYGRGHRLLRSLAKRFPEAQGWYNPKTLRKHLPKEYDLILVDGPPRDFGRVGFLQNIDLFRHDVPIVLDDLHRPDDLLMARMLAEKLERDLLITNNINGKKPFGVLLP